MRRTLWNALVAFGIAAAALMASPTALSSSKKTPTPAAEASPAKTSSDKAARTEKVNLNTADEKTIAGAKGVGEKLAKELVKSRPYKTWEEVSKVKGVGSGKKLESLKKVLKLSEGVGTATKEEPAAEKENKGKKPKSSSKGEGTSSAASGGGSTGGGAGAAAGGSTGTGKAAESAPPSSPSKKSSSSSSSSTSSTKLAPGTKININTATKEELDALPEIGPVKAQAIVEYREANGKFSAPEDIMKVTGIKEGTYAKIKDYIVVK